MSTNVFGLNKSGTRVEWQFNLDKNTAMVILSAFVLLAASTYVISQVPLFGDGCSHGLIIRETFRVGRLLESNPRGWLDPPFENPVSVGSKIRYFHIFYVTNAMLTQFTESVELSLAITNILPLIFLLFVFFSLSKHAFNKAVAAYSTLFLSFTPMLLWVSSHRLMEPMVYFLAILCVFQYMRYLKKGGLGSFLALILLMVAALGTKQSAIFAVVGILVHLFIKRGSKEFTVAVFLVFLLLVPILGFTARATGSIPLLADVPFVENFAAVSGKQDIASWERELNRESGAEKYEDVIIKKTKTLLFFHDYLKSGNIFGVLQYFSPLPVHTAANNHWFSPASDSVAVAGFFLFLLTIGILGLCKSKNDKGRTFLSLLLVVSSFASLGFTRYAIATYLFYVNILFSIAFGIGVYLLQGQLKTHRVVKLFLALLVVTTLNFMLVASVRDALAYRHTFSNAPLEAGGIQEIIQFSKQFKIPRDTYVFSPSQEVPYYLGVPVVWDFRLFLIPKRSVMRYLEYYNVSYLLIPRFSISPSFGNKLNTLENWYNPKVIPVDSGFYELLKENRIFERVAEYKGFVAYSVNYRELGRVEKANED